MSQSQNNAEHIVKTDENGKWLPGHSPKSPGRPKGSVSLKTVLKKRMGEVFTDANGNQKLNADGEPMTYAEVLVEQTMIAALKGDHRARKIAWEYIDGKATQHITADVSSVTIVDDIHPD